MREHKFKIGTRVFITSGCKRGNYAIVTGFYTTFFGGVRYAVRIDKHLFTAIESELCLPISSIIRESNAKNQKQSN